MRKMCSDKQKKNGVIYVIHINPDEEMKYNEKEEEEKNKLVP